MTQGILWLKFADIKRIACAYFRRIYIYLNVACTIHSVCSLSHCFFFASLSSLSFNWIFSMHLAGVYSIPNLAKSSTDQYTIPI